MTEFAEVIVTLPVSGLFHYAVPPHLEGKLKCGHRVLVPFGRRRTTAFVVRRSAAVPQEVASKIRPIAEQLDAEPLVPLDILKLAKFVADYYLACPGEVLKMALPPGLTAASLIRYRSTTQGRRLLEDHAGVLPDGSPLSDRARQILELAAKGPGIRAHKLPKGVRTELERWNLIERTNVVRPSESERKVEVAWQTKPPEAAKPLLARAKTRRAIYLALGTTPRTTDSLVGPFKRPTLRAALKRLEADGLIQRRRVPVTAVNPETPKNGVETNPRPSLTEEQTQALGPIIDAVEQGAQKNFLLHGVTGSGKTEVYLRAIEAARKRKRGAIILVPEIALTPQLEARFRERFGHEVVVLHSAIPDKERRERWQLLRSGKAHIALGPRSTVWAPVRELSVVVVDEEHDTSFKQNSDVRYNGRDLALVRAKQAGGVAILGSATPSLESYHLADLGKLETLRLKRRVGKRPLPRVQLVDLKKEHKSNATPHLSQALADKIREVVDKQEQAILFLNRRGFNTVVYCEDCAQSRTCLHCDVSLTHHRTDGSLKCHHCGHTEPMNRPCPKCQSEAMSPFGAGTQRIAEEIKEIAPDARILRLDRDTASTLNALNQTLKTFRDGQADILVGTQMVAKGHDFPKVTLVGIVLADASLSFPDFRASERTFQLLTQVAGRAGRAKRPGEVVIQSFQPNHEALQCAIEHDTDRFIALEAASRKELHYPPFTRMGMIRIESKDDDQALAVAQRIAQSARNRSKQVIRVCGPARAPVARIRERFRHMIMLLAPSRAPLIDLMRRLSIDFERLPHSVDVVFDVDPYDLL